MLDNVVLIITGAALLAVIGIEFGGTFLLKVAGGGIPANDLQKQFFRAGHGHAGVLVILGLVVVILVFGNGVPQPFAGASFAVLASSLIIPAGFFLSVTGRDPVKANGMIALVWIGAAVLAIGLLAAGIGLIVAGASGLS